MTPEARVPSVGRRAAASVSEPDAPDPRYYDFRSLLRVVDEEPWLDRLEATTRAWIAEKHPALDAGLPSARIAVDHEVRLDGLEREDVSALRLTLAERGDQGEWLTEVLGVEVHGRGGWINVTVRNSEQRFGNRPRLVPRLLESLTTLDGNSGLDDETWMIGRDHFREFATVLADPDRRAPVFVAAARPGQDLEHVRGWMQRRSRELAGLAHSYVLDAEANALLMRYLGRGMGVQPGSIRSYAPRPIAFDDDDALRHRRIGAGHLEKLPPRPAADLVGRIARFEAWALPEPLLVRDIRRAFDRKVLSERFRVESGVRPHGRGPAAGPSTGPSEARPAPLRPAPVSPAETGRAEPTTPQASPAGPLVEPREPARQSTPDTSSSPAPASPTEPDVPVSPASPAAQPAPTRPVADPDRLITEEDAQAPGRSEPEDQRAPEAGQAPDPAVAALLAVTGSTSVAEALDWARTMTEILGEAERDALAQQARTDRLADDAAELQRSHTDLERELAGEISRRHTAEQNARALTAFTPTARTDGDDPTEPVAHPADGDYPQHFSEIPIAALYLEPYVEFTGDPSVTEELDEFDTSTVGAKRCWEGLLALYDYARARAEGTHDDSLFRYLQSTPSGHAGYGVAHYAGKESTSTTSRRDLADQRLFRVPPTVDPSGQVHMWAHLKLTQVGRISPRLHFHDDVAGSGKVYVGYIGRHLGISST